MALVALLMLDIMTEFIYPDLATQSGFSTSINIDSQLSVTEYGSDSFYSIDDFK